MRKLVTEPGNSLSPSPGPGVPVAAPSPWIAIAVTPACCDAAAAAQPTEPHRLHKWPHGHCRQPTW